MKQTTPQGLILVISAPSGTGKTTLCKQLLAEFPELRFSVSCTTRPPRRGERDGVDYHFISVEEFNKRKSAGEFVEWEEIYGHFYGTSQKNIEEMIYHGYDVVLDIDTRGAHNVKGIFPDAVLVFVMPPSVETLMERLHKRGSETDDVIRIRFEKAMEEIQVNESYDYVIFNDIVENSVMTLRSVYIAEKNRRNRLQSRIDDFYRTTGGM